MSATIESHPYHPEYLAQLEKMALLLGAESETGRIHPDTLLQMAKTDALTGGKPEAVFWPFWQRKTQTTRTAVRLG